MECSCRELKQTDILCFYLLCLLMQEVGKFFYNKLLIFIFPHHCSLYLSFHSQIDNQKSWLREGLFST